MNREDWRGALVAEFAEPEALVAALERATEAGYSRIDAFMPFPVKGVAEALDLRQGLAGVDHDRRVSWRRR